MSNRFAGSIVHSTEQMLARVKTLADGGGQSVKYDKVRTAWPNHKDNKGPRVNIAGRNGTLYKKFV